MDGRNIDKIETDCEDVNLKNIGLIFFKLSPFSLKQVVNNKIRLGNQFIFVCYVSEIPSFT